ncbi:unnamed protein product [Mycena citricolor]|uniref:Uncharacterized protein n=1 Tax=Mycena citricolor TaxID=2018698 RepID=A0AAD2HA27_9AGAR|nr:unnamed protein product [Mycena citricolor]
MMAHEVSALGPIDPASVPQEHDEEEKHAPWIVRKLIGSMTGRLVMTGYESLRAAGTSIVCLSPWGDSSPLMLPCIRFRDLAVHTVVAATGGMAVVAAPVLGSVGTEVISVFGDTILVEIGLHAGFEMTAAAADELVSEPIKKIIPIHSKRLETTGVKELLITLKYKMTMTDAALGYFRSSVHKDNSLFSTVKDYLAIEKGWFSPYLFASARRPIIPRTMSPDVVFCHGPFLEGDYQIGKTLLAESAQVLAFCKPAPVTPAETPEEKPQGLIPKLPSLTNMLRSRPASPSEPEHVLTALPPPPKPRRMVVVTVGLKPHRTLWTTSARPGESVINYILLNGCPAIVVPVKVGAPLVAWDSMTLQELWKVELPASDSDISGGKFGGIVAVLFEYLDLCVDWDRVSIGEEGVSAEVDSRQALKNALGLLLAATVRSKDSKQVKKEIDKERSGIAMWRIP